MALLRLLTKFYIKLTLLDILKRELLKKLFQVFMSNINMDIYKILAISCPKLIIL